MAVSFPWTGVVSTWQECVHWGEHSLYHEWRMELGSERLRDWNGGNTFLQLNGLSAPEPPPSFYNKARALCGNLVAVCLGILGGVELLTCLPGCLLALLSSPLLSWHYPVCFLHLKFLETWVLRFLVHPCTDKQPQHQKPSEAWKATSTTGSEFPCPERTPDSCSCDEGPLPQRNVNVIKDY
jgi:hypothetical protein